MVSFTTDLAKFWVGAADRAGGLSVLASPRTWASIVSGLDGLACVSVCDTMLKILEDCSSMYTPGSALKRTSLFGICSLLGHSLLSSEYQCLFFCPSCVWGDLSLCLSGAYLAACPPPPTPHPRPHTPAPSSCYSPHLPRCPAQF